MDISVLGGNFKGEICKERISLQKFIFSLVQPISTLEVTTKFFLNSVLVAGGLIIIIIIQ